MKKVLLYISIFFGMSDSLQSQSLDSTFHQRLLNSFVNFEKLGEQIFIEGSGPLAINYFNSAHNSFGLVSYSIESDLCNVIVYILKDQKWQYYQTIDSIPIALPLHLKRVKYGSTEGFLISKDFAHKYGFANLLSYDINSYRFRLFPNFDKLGNIFSVPFDTTYFFTYHTCGCADACWKSQIITLNKFDIIKYMEIYCDCDSLHEYSLIPKKILIKTSICPSVDKIEFLGKRWSELIKEGVINRKK